MGRRWVVLLVLVSGFAAISPARAVELQMAGSVKVAEGACFARRDGVRRPIAAGERLYVADTLQTGPDGALGVIFRDDTTLTLGPDTEIEVEQFAFEPAKGRLAMVLHMVKGVVSYLSGQIAKLSPDSVRFQTPVAAVGVRGTRFLARVDPR